jgi:hypothetical protein
MTLCNPRPRSRHRIRMSRLCAGRSTVNCSPISIMSSSNTINSNPDSAQSCEQTQRRPTTIGYSHGACITCRRRKVKCDQNAPCSNCVRNAIKCEIVPRKRSVRRPKTIADKEKQELIQRVHKLESESAGWQIFIC